MWNRNYFRFGVPIYVRLCKIETERSPKDVAEVLNNESSLSIRLISDNEIAVREVFGILARGGVMHGIVLLNPGRDTAKIIGYLDWTVLAFGIALLFLRSWLTLPFLLILVALYGVAKIRFDKLCEMLHRQPGQWSG